MNSSFDLQELSMESTSSKSVISKIAGYLVGKNSYLKPNYEDSENFTPDEIEKGVEDNFKIEYAPSEFSECGTDNLYFYANSEEEKSDDENEISFLGKKTNRKEINCNDDEEDDPFNKKIFAIEKIDIAKKFNYRKDYYIMEFKGNFLSWTLQEMQTKIDNCNFCKKFGKAKIHIANRELYGGNPKEEDNREFINKTIEEVFTLTEEQKNSLKKVSRQKANEELINKIKDYYYEKLLIKKEKDKKYLNQFNAIKEFIEFIQLTIKEALDMYYDSDEFKKFKSRRVIQYYDEKFSSERNRGFSLLVKNNFVAYVNLPFYSNKRKA